MTRLTRFAVAPLHSMTRCLADVASARVAPDLVITGARVLSTYSERILPVGRSGSPVAASPPSNRPARRRRSGRGATLRRRRRHHRAGAGRPAHPHRIQHGDGLRLCRGCAPQRHHHDLLRQPRDRQRHGRRRCRGDAGGRARGAALDLPDGAEHGAGHVAGTGDRGRRPHAGQDRRPVRPLARSRRARREDGLRAGHDGRRAQPCHPCRCACSAGGRCPDTSTGASSSRPMRRPASPTPTRRSTATSPTICSTPASGSSCAAARRPRRGTRCRRRSARSPSSVRRTSALPSAPTTAMPTTFCCSASTGWCARPSRPACRPNRPGRWARCMVPPASAWTAISAALAAAAAPTSCCSTTSSDRNAPGMAASWW